MSLEKMRELYAQLAEAISEAIETDRTVGGLMRELQAFGVRADVSIDLNVYYPSPASSPREQAKTAVKERQTDAQFLRAVGISTRPDDRPPGKRKTHYGEK